MHIDHINISAPAELLLKVRDFYCDVLGLSGGFRPKLSRPGYWLYADGKPIIHLVESQQHHWNDRQGFFDHFALKTTGAAKVLKKLDETGAQYQISHLPEIGLTQIFCKDPAGTGVEINFLDESL